MHTSPQAKDFHIFYVTSSDPNGRESDPKHFFIGYLPGTGHSAETSKLCFLPSKKAQNLGSETSQTCLGLNPDCNN